MIIRAKAPLRLAFGGGGTDVSPYPEERGGAVLNAAIDRYAYASLEPTDNGKVEILSLDFERKVLYEFGTTIQGDAKLDLVKAVVGHFADRLPRTGCSAVLHSDAPPRSGVGSSSALVAALVGTLSEWLALRLSNYDLARTAFQIEREELGVPGGRQDHYAATFGGFNYMEFEADRVVVNPLRIQRELLNELEYRLILCYTGTPHADARIIETQMDRYRAREAGTTAALDRLKAAAREMKDALLLGDLERFGALLDDSWRQKQRLTAGITNPTLDGLYERARAAGALGGKVSGAGGGGYMYFLAAAHRRHEVARAVAEAGCTLVPFGFEPRGLQVWRVP